MKRFGNMSKYIAIEGPIGVGKSSLAKKLATEFNAKLILEQPADNPFLSRFYKSPAQFALSAQLFFLYQRAQQLSLSKSDIINDKIACVADFMMEKDPLFAQVNLDDDEYQLYRNAYQNLRLDVTPPNLVIYLQAPIKVLLERVNKRSVSYERSIAPDYLQRLSEAYTDYFYYYDSSPLLTVNVAEINFVDNLKHYQALVEHIRNIKAGKHFFNPLAEAQ